MNNFVGKKCTKAQKTVQVYKVNAQYWFLVVQAIADISIINNLFINYVFTTNKIFTT